MKAEIDMYSKEAVDCSKTKKLKHNLKRKKKSKEGKKKKKVNGISVVLMRAFTTQALNWYFCASTIIQVKSKTKQNPTNHKTVYAEIKLFSPIYPAMSSGQCCATKNVKDCIYALSHNLSNCVSCIFKTISL